MIERTHVNFLPQYSRSGATVRYPSPASQSAWCLSLKPPIVCVGEVDLVGSGS
jgi:hypothetical protein